MAQLKTGAAMRALGLVAVVVVGAAVWRWNENREVEKDMATQNATPAQPAPVITPDTVEPPAPRHIYPEVSSAAADIAVALREAKESHKHVIVDFGGDWCPDCQVLDVYFHQSPNRELLEQNFVKVNVNIGRMDQNLDIAMRYGVPISKGVPALAVLDSDGKVVYAQASGEFEAMRRMQSSAVTEFLNKWKPARA